MNLSDSNQMGDIGTTGDLDRLMSTLEQALDRNDELYCGQLKLMADVEKLTRQSEKLADALQHFAPRTNDGDTMGYRELLEARNALPRLEPPSVVTPSPTQKVSVDTPFSQYVRKVFPLTTSAAVDDLREKMRDPEWAAAVDQVLSEIAPIRSTARPNKRIRQFLGGEALAQLFNNVQFNSCPITESIRIACRSHPRMATKEAFKECLINLVRYTRVRKTTLRKRNASKIKLPNDEVRNLFPISTQAEINSVIEKLKDDTFRESLSQYLAVLMKDSEKPMKSVIQPVFTREGTMLYVNDIEASSCPLINVIEQVFTSHSNTSAHDFQLQFKIYAKRARAMYMTARHKPKPFAAGEPSEDGFYSKKNSEDEEDSCEW